MMHPAQQRILHPSNEMVPLIGLSEHNAKQIASGGMLNVHPNVADIVSNRDRNTLTRNSTGPILHTFERPSFVGSVVHWTSSHQSSGPHPGTFNDIPPGMVNNYSTVHEDNLSISLPGLIANEDSSEFYSMSPIGLSSHNNAMDDSTELGHANSFVAVPPASTESLVDLQGIIGYSTIELPPPSYSFPNIHDSAPVNHTIVRMPDRCPSKEYHELYLGNKSCSCGLSPKSRQGKVEKGFMCIQCRVPFTTRKNGNRHARSAKIHECSTCHKFFARVDYRNLHGKNCSGKKGLKLVMCQFQVVHKPLDHPPSGKEPGTSGPFSDRKGISIILLQMPGVSRHLQKFEENVKSISTPSHHYSSELRTTRSINTLHYSIHQHPALLNPSTPCTTQSTVNTLHYSIHQHPALLNPSTPCTTQSTVNTLHYSIRQNIPPRRRNYEDLAGDDA
ncbi:hypothetical protein BU17DRAFT_66874 [Hysterangium stoloniferum]|nr:hypothetical protein BU17DRAFT_66874 [Hysterangium stoloniferum]